MARHKNTDWNLTDFDPLGMDRGPNGNVQLPRPDLSRLQFFD